MGYSDADANEALEATKQPPLGRTITGDAEQEGEMEGGNICGDEDEGEVFEYDAEERRGGWQTSGRAAEGGVDARG